MDRARREVGHLLRRAGFGATPVELEAAMRAGYDATVEQLLHPERVSDDAEARVAARELHPGRAEGLREAWLYRMLFTRRPLQEKMVLFWHGHLVSAAFSKITIQQAPALFRNQLAMFRELALGNWRELLYRISRDPVMLIYLDHRLSRRGAPNENYARELFELFTLGIGNYTERDVSEAARAFTGWSLDHHYEFIHYPNQHDDGPKTIFGRTGNWGPDDVINLLLEQPAAAPHLARKLFRFFAYDDPEPPLVERLADVFRRSGYDLRALVGAILRSPEFRSERAYHAQIKSPVEFLIGSLKALSADRLPYDVSGILRRMGQDLLDPPSVKGWDGGPSWINANTMIERTNLANRLAVVRGERDERYLDPMAVGSLHATPEALVEHVAEWLLEGDLPAANRAVLEEYLREGADITADPNAWDMKVRGLVHLMMASPMYQLN
jgi:uncharacterized protein (DUF1800 family)